MYVTESDVLFQVIGSLVHSSHWVLDVSCPVSLPGPSLKWMIMGFLFDHRPNRHVQEPIRATPRIFYTLERLDRCLAMSSVKPVHEFSVKHMDRSPSVSRCWLARTRDQITCCLTGSVKLKKKILPERFCKIIGTTNRDVFSAFDAEGNYVAESSLSSRNFWQWTFEHQLEGGYLSQEDVDFLLRGLLTAFVLLVLKAAWMTTSLWGWYQINNVFLDWYSNALVHCPWKTTVSSRETTKTRLWYNQFFLS